MLEIENLNIDFRGGAKAVRGVSFVIEKAEIFALVGESGSGKSATALSILNLLPETAELSGRVLFEGRDLAKLAGNDLRKIRGNEISMIFQEPMTSLNPLHTIGRQIAESISLHQNLAKSAIKNKVAELLELVELKSFESRLSAYPHELSGGQRQRVMIAMALANNPKLLIADEPTTALDVTVQAAILKLIQDLQKKLGMAVLLITHDLTIVRKVAARVAVMKNGHLVEVGKTEQIFSSPKADYTKKLIASEPKGSAIALAAANQNIITVKNLSVEFQIRKYLFKPATLLKAVDSANMEIKKGESLGLVGESGSGKSTLAQGILRLVKAKGSISFHNQEITHLPYSKIRLLRKNMQVIFQDPYSSLNPRMTVFEIIAEGLRAHGEKKAIIEEKVKKALQEVGLPEEALQRYPHQFSGGQRQRIAIARSLVLNPEFLVLDEPTSALDLTTQSEIIDLLKKLQKERGLTYLFISHDLRVIKALCHRVMVMKDGKIVEEGEVAAIFNNPKEAYTKTLISAVL